jgi:nucleotide-binding universal stress UspA family protein
MVKAASMKELAVPQPVVVGIDGSKAALRAALWAVDEAVSRDAPLRLLCAIEPDDNRETEPDAAARKLATAETALRHAVAAIEAEGTPVKIETEVTHAPAIGSLISASASAAIVCVGAIGLRHFRPGRVGSTAAALAVSARCPVAIVRARDNHVRRPAERIVVEVDGSPDNGVLLGAAIEEARLCNAALHAIICRRTEPGENGAADTEDNRRALADLDRRLARWKRRHPDLRVESMAVHGSLMEYLAHNHRSVRLVIVGANNHKHLSELVGPAGSAVLQDADCSLLIVNQHHL